MLETVILDSMPELTLYEFNALFTLVSNERQRKIMQYQFMRDSQNCLLGDILSRIQICRITGVSNEQLEFSNNDYGKPFLVNNPYINFNISHAGHYVACVVSDKPVGIDIELIEPIDLAIAEKYFASDETAYIMESNHTLRFYEIWTKKESYIKKEGKGLYKPLTSFSVFDLSNNERLMYHEIFNNNDAICCVCSAEHETPTSKVIDTFTLLQYVNKYLLTSFSLTSNFVDKNKRSGDIK